MGANFSPNITEVSPTPTFRYWCQKVLPLVYDDSLSYYELLCKVVNYLNSAIGDINTLAGDVSALNTSYQQLEDYVNSYFESLDVSAAINAKLDEMASDGSLTALISPLIPGIVTDWLENNIQPTTPAVDSSLTVSGAAADAKTVGDNDHAGYAVGTLSKIAVNKTNKTLTLKSGSAFFWDGNTSGVIASDITYTESDVPASFCKVYITSSGTLSFVPYYTVTPVTKNMGLLGYLQKSTFDVYSPTNVFSPNQSNVTISDIISESQQLACVYSHVHGVAFMALCGNTLFIDCGNFRLYNKLTLSYETTLDDTFTLDGSYSQRFINFENGSFSGSATYTNKSIAVYISGEGCVFPLIDGIIANRRKPLDGYVRSGHLFYINLEKYKINDESAVIGYESPEVRYNKHTYGLTTGTKRVCFENDNYINFNLTQNSASLSNKNILMIGDSFVARGYIQNFLHSLDSTINFIGTKTTQYYNYDCEAVSGSRLYYFTDPETSPFAYPDQTLGLAKYLHDNELPVPDIVVINSAINQVSYYDDTHGSYLEQLTTLVNIFYNYSPAIKVYVTHGANYAVNNGSVYGEPYNRFVNVMRCINAIYDSSLDTKIVRIPIFDCLDDTLDYTYTSVPYLNSTVSVLEDCVHPAENTGFKKIAEQIYNYLGI